MLYRLTLLIGATAGVAAPAQSAEYDPGRFEKEVIVTACSDPMQMEITRDGRVYFIERNGTLNLKEPGSKTVAVLGQRPVHLTGEIGLLGLALARDFEQSQALFLFFAPLEKQGTLRLSRFLLKDGRLDLASERMLFDYPLERPNLQHQGGGLFMSAAGDLIVGTGDSTTTIPEIQLDERPGFKTHDAQRTAANSMDLRGKILRIRPTTEGGYLIPNDNLFPDGKSGRPEIFAMGVRNGFRQYFDDATGFVYWGDVGQNIDESIRAGPNGYDEINQARVAGFFGWPYFTGPNEAYRKFDFVSRQAGAPFDPRFPRNDSPNNTGARELPAAQPALIWYPSGESQVFPTLGRGGRSAMVGPVYRHDPTVVNELKLPTALHRVLFIFDWMRNWIQCVHLDADDRVARIEPFLPAMRFRKPIELKLAPDHTLYLIESGDKWGGNTDSQISRLVYRSGNRPPVAIAEASHTTGKAPLRVKFDASRSTDKDREPLQYAWRFGDLGQSTEVSPEFTFEKPRLISVTLTATDPSGTTGTTALEIAVGNAPPRLEFLSPLDGGIYEPGKPVAYRLSVTDEEDGTIIEERVAVEATQRARVGAGEELSPALRLMQAMACFGCHAVSAKSVGPSFIEVASRYRGDSAAADQLARKIVAGGIGTWGSEVAMPPQPHVSPDQAQTIARWVLARSTAGSTTQAGLSGMFAAPKSGTARDWMPPVLALEASYSDNGFGGLPAMRATREVVLHPRIKRAASFDRSTGAEIVDVFEGRVGNVTRLSKDGWFAIDRINLEGLDELVLHLAPLTRDGVRMEVRVDSPHGALVARATTRHAESNTSDVVKLSLPIEGRKTLQSLFFVARHEGNVPGPVVDVHWIEFKSNAP
jgi:cytochrome c